jgi:hydrogenase large subunit
VPAGFARGTCAEAFDQREVTEHVAHSWYVDDPAGRHPFDGQTQPYACGDEGKKYSWVKAPRYAGAPAETGPLAEMVIARNPLLVDLVKREGPSVFVRELARLVRPAELLPAMQQWLDEIQPDGDYYVHPPDPVEGQGFGLISAPRGALGHWTNIEDGKIKNYQVITPTAWNGSPRDDDGVRGPWEEALIGTPVKNHDNPVEVGHVVRSFDPCLVCAVHAVQGPKSLFRKTL